MSEAETQNRNKSDGENAVPAEKRRRRTKYDENNRDHKCDCGKSYLSYPALYTHIKTKHEGKRELALRNNPNPPSSTSSPPPPSRPLTTTIDSLNSLSVFLAQALTIQASQRESRQKPNSLQKEDQKYLKTIRDFWTGRRKEDFRSGEGTIETTIDHALARFLLDMEPTIDRNSMSLLEELVVYTRRGLNELRGDSGFCEKNSVDSLLGGLNELFGEKLSKREGHLFARQPAVACVALYHLGKWLCEQGFSSRSLQLNVV